MDTSISKEPGYKDTYMMVLPKSLGCTCGQPTRDINHVIFNLLCLLFVATYRGFTGDIVKIYNKIKDSANDAWLAISSLMTIHMYKVVYIITAVVITREVR